MSNISGDFNFLNLEEICRSCMSKKQKMRPLFGSSLDSMLMSVANVKVSLNDGFPAQMCVQCVLQVSRAFTFKQQCEKSDAAIREHLANQQAKSATVPVEPDEGEPKPELQLITLHPDSPGLEYRINGNAGNECVLILRSVKIPPVPEKESNSLVASNVDSFLQKDELQLVEESQERTVEIVEHEDSTDFEIDRDDLVCNLGQQLLEDGCYEIDDAYNTKQEEIITEDQNNSVNFRCEDCHISYKSNDELKIHKVCCPAFTQPVQTESNYSVSSGGDQRTINLECLASSNETSATTNARFECNVCKKRFADSSKLRRHSRTHLVHKPHVCKICGMSFAESSNLTKHNRKHTGELRNVVGKPNLCSICGKRFKWTTSLSKHMKHHTKRKLFWCTFPGCGKYYVEQRSLNIHSYTHDGRKPFSCQYCSKGFTQKCNLEKHERVHTGQKPFRCNICFKSFAQSGYLVIHHRIHSQDRPYSCQECGKQFTASNALTVHLRTHSGVRNYGCDTCGKRFSRQETLNIHVARKHSDERPPHGCVLCEARFDSGEELTEHMKSEHGDRVYHMCPSCGKVYASMQSLKNHQKVHLKDNSGHQQRSELGFEQPCETEELLPGNQIVESDKLVIENIDVIYG